MDGLRLNLSGSQAVHDVGDGVWTIDWDTRIIMYLTVNTTIGEPVNVQFRPFMTAEE